MAKKQVNHYQEALKELQKEAKSKGKTFELSNRYSPYSQALEELSTRYKLGEQGAVKKAVEKERAGLSFLQRHITDREWEKRATETAKNIYASRQARQSDLLRHGLRPDPITQYALDTQKGTRQTLAERSLRSERDKRTLATATNVTQAPFRLGQSLLEQTAKPTDTILDAYTKYSDLRDINFIWQQENKAISKLQDTRKQRELTQDEQLELDRLLKSRADTISRLPKKEKAFSEVDRTKVAGAGAELALTVGTAGIGNPMAVSKAKIPLHMALSGAMGAGHSVASTAMEKGEKATTEEYVKSGATGGALAAAITGLGSAYGVRKQEKAIEKAKQQAGLETQQKVNEIGITSKGKTEKVSAKKGITEKLNQEGGYVNLKTAEIDKQASDLAKLQSSGKEAATSKAKAILHKKTSGLKTVEGNLSSHSEQGKKIANKMRIQASVSSTLESDGEKVIKGFDNISDNRFKKITDAIAGGDVDKLTGENKKIAQKLINLTNTRHEQELASGIKVGYRKNYVPRMLDMSQENKIRKWALDNGKMKELEIIIKNRNDIFSDKKAFNEFHRAVEALPEEFYLSPKEAYAAFNRATADRIADVKVWGVNREALQKDLTEIAKLDGGTDMVDYVRTYFEREGLKKPISKALSTPSDYIIASKMRHSTISNATQTVNTANIAGYKNTASAIKSISSKSGWKTAEQKALDYGIGLTDMTDSLTSKIGKRASARVAGEGLKSKALYAVQNPTETTLTLTGFNNIEKVNRLVAVEAGERYIKQLAKSPLAKNNSRILTRLGVNPLQIANNGLTKGDLAFGVRNFVGETQFFTGTKDLPLWTSSDLGGLVTRLNKFSMKQTQHIATIAKEARYGNFAPLVRWGLGSTAVGELAFATRSAIMGKKRKYTLQEMLDKATDGEVNTALKMALSRFKENVDVTGGLGYIEDQFSSLEYGKTAKDKAIGASGPVVSTIADTIENAWGIANNWNSDKGERNYRTQQLTKKALQGSFSRDILTNYKRLTGQKYFTAPKKDGKELGTKDLTIKQSVLKGVEESSQPYDPRSEKYWTIRASVNNNITREEINEAVKKERKGKSIEDTPFYAKLMKSYNKLDNPKKKKQVRDFLKGLGV